MKNFFVRAEIGEGYPDYEFIVKAKNLSTAKIHARLILKQDYPDIFTGKYEDRFSCRQVNQKQLLELMTIN